MALQADVLIRDFRVRGNYFNRRTLISKEAFHHLKKHEQKPFFPGYSAPEVAIEFQDGSTDNLIVSEIDTPFLCDGDFRDGSTLPLELVLTLGRGQQYCPSLILQKKVCTVRDESAYA